MKENEKLKQENKTGQDGDFHLKWGLGSWTKYAEKIKWVHKNAKHIKKKS